VLSSGLRDNNGVGDLYLFGFFSKIFGIEKDNYVLCLAQYKSILHLAPLFFLIMSSSLIAIAFVNMGYAPVYLTIIVPLVLLIGDLVIFNSLTIPRSSNGQSHRRLIVNRLHATIWGVVALGLARVFWVNSLLGFGDRETEQLIVIFVATSTFGAALCLMHLRVAALSLIGITMLPLIGFLWLDADPVYMTLAMILTLVSAVVLYVANRYGEDFARMVMQQKEVEAKKIEAEQLSKLNIKMANLDSLTGLANRRAFMTNLKSQVDSVNTGQVSGLAVGILDLDGFKQINDVYGHLAGDRLLQAVSKRLTDLLFGKVFVARMGGDEFGIIVSGGRGDQKLVTLGERICEAMKLPFSVGGFKANLGGSLGFARWENTKDSAEKLFEKADYALYHAKDSIRGSVMIFNEQHAATIRKVSNVEHRLQDADFEDEMSLVFQPIVASRNANTIGFEALARWQSPILGSIPPDVFIRSAERAGLINRLSNVLLKKALREAKNWPQNMHLSFNLSMQDITSSEAMVKLVSIINASGFDPRRITFEVTETSIMSDYERAMESLNFLKSLGTKIALDDFGTGYSSLAYIRQMPLDKLKLDRGFIAGIENDESASAIVQAMINRGWNLKIDCIVEGVETKSQFKTLSAMGCEIFQGYYFSRPLQADETLAFALTEQAIVDVSMGISALS